MEQHPPISENRSLKDLCTFGIGGPAKLFVEVNTIPELQIVISKCYSEKIPYFILGKGSNCLFDDKGFDGLVIANKIDFCETKSAGHYYVGAGYSFSLLGTQTARQGWSGLEFASGIPGSVGGAVFMNAGANGKETCETLVSVDFVHPDGTIESIEKSKLQFAYRTSSFQNMPGAIAAAHFQLIPCIEARKQQLSIIDYRMKTQPYKDKSAGCIFRNPSNNHAGALIEKCDLKGTIIGGAQVSEMHANFIVNRKNASSEDILAMIQLIKQRVKEKMGVELESEVRYIPSSPEIPLEKS